MATDPTQLLLGSHGGDYPGATQDQIKALKDYFKKAGIPPDNQREIVNAIIDRSFGRGVPISVRETVDLAHEKSHPGNGKAAAAAAAASAGGTPVPEQPVNPWDLGRKAIANQAAKQNAQVTPTSPADEQAAAAAAAQPSNLVNQEAEAETGIPQAQWDEMDVSLGLAPGSAHAMWKANYLQFQNADKARGITRAVDQGAKPPVPPPSAAAWFQQQKATLEGPPANAYVIEQLASQYAVDNGSPMPASLRKQLRDTINKMPFSQQQQMALAVKQATTAQIDPATGNPLPASSQSQSTTDAIKYLAGIQGSLQSSVVDVQAMTAGGLAAQEAKSQATITHSRLDAYFQAFGSLPDAATVAKWSSMNQVQFQDFLDAQPYKLGMNKKQYDAAAGQISSAWQSAFGVPASDATIAWARGKSQQQVTDFINSQPSRVKGMNVGQFNGIQQSGDKISQDLWGHPMDDHLVSLVFGNISKDNPRATPAPPALSGTAQNPLPSTVNSPHTLTTDNGGALPSAT
jgi:hypothetical protein